MLIRDLYEQTAAAGRITIRNGTEGKRTTFSWFVNDVILGIEHAWKSTAEKTEMTRANESNLIFIWGLKKKRDWIVGRILCTSTKDEKTTAISQGLTGFLKRGRKWDRTGIKRNVSRRLRYIQRENVFDYKNLMIGDHQFLRKCLLANWKSSKLGELRLLRECISFSRALLFIYLFFFTWRVFVIWTGFCHPDIGCHQIGGKKGIKSFHFTRDINKKDCEFNHRKTPPTFRDCVDFSPFPDSSKTTLRLLKLLYTIKPFQRDQKWWFF